MVQAELVGSAALAVLVGPAVRVELAARAGPGGQEELAAQDDQAAAGKRPIVRPRARRADPAAEPAPLRIVQPPGPLADRRKGRT